MSDAIITVENLGKCYRLQHQQRERYTTLRDLITNRVKSLFGTQNSEPGTQNSEEDFWALKDVSFEIKQGEVVGIIGRNGAGKSTLLKILSRITEPTKGRITLRGRVASLLEVGTGFHPELTGRENIFLNGAILGMTRAEIRSKFDEIVAFAEVEKFLDTPVKRYSSGMYVRLAFAVAAHLEPEILVVDEVLAVGDAEFQKKCLGRMEAVASQGRTVLFVSHNMATVRALCSRAILMKGGSVGCEGNVQNLTDMYGAVEIEDTETENIPAGAHRPGNTGQAVFQTIRICNITGAKTSQLYLGQPFRLTLTLEATSDIREAVIEVGLVASDGTHVTCSRTLDGGAEPFPLPRGRHEVTLEINAFLLPRRYSFALILYHFDGHIIDWVDQVQSLTVANIAEDSSDTYRFWPSIRGYVRPEGVWHLPFPQKGARVK